MMCRLSLWDDNSRRVISILEELTSGNCTMKLNLPSSHSSASARSMHKAYRFPLRSV